MPTDHRRVRLAVAGVLAVSLAAGLLFLGGLPPWGCGSGQQSPPPTAFAFDQAGPTGNATVTVTHGGGDELPAGRLLVAVGGKSRTWAARTAAGRSSAVVAGDALTLTGLETGTVVTVRYDHRGNVTRNCVDDPGSLGRYAVE